MTRRPVPAFPAAALATGLFALAVPYPQALAGEPTSWVNVPIRVSLPAVQERLNAEVPKRLATISENNMICFKGKKVSYKYPCFRGIKIYSCEGWTWAAPPIRCDVSGHVDLNGSIRLGGNGGTLDVAVPVYAQVSGEVAGISETAKAQATITAAITPGIDENWQVTAGVRPDLVWDQKPELKLFNLIKITITGKVEPKLREELGKFTDKLPAMLAELDVKTKVAAAWDKLQDPVLLSPDGPLYLTFSPGTVGFSGINVAKNVLTANVALSGVAKVTAGAAPGVEKRPLANLTPIPQNAGGFRFTLPVEAELAAVTALVSEKFPDGHTVTLDEGALKGELVLDDLQISGTTGGRLAIALDVAYDNRNRFWQLIDIFDWFDTTGTVRFTARPVIDPLSRTLRVEDLTLEADTNNSLADSLVAIANLPLLRDFLAGAITHEFGGDLDAAIASANTVLNRDLGDGVMLKGTIAATELSELRVTPDRITVLADASGLVSIRLRTH